MGRLEAHPRSAFDKASAEKNPFADESFESVASNESGSGGGENRADGDYGEYPDPPLNLPHDDSDSDSPDSDSDGSKSRFSFGRDGQMEKSGRTTGVSNAQNGPLHHPSSTPQTTTAPSTTIPKNNIDNSALVYLAVRMRCGVLAFCRPDVLIRCPKVLSVLNDDLTVCLRVLPPSVRRLVRRTRIWINLSYAYGPLAQPRVVKHSTAHHHHGWLLWARDRPEKVRGIEIYSAAEYMRMRLHWNGAGLMLHELCHLIHQLTLPDGLDNGAVRALYHRAKKSGRYDEVLRRDWAGLPPSSCSGGGTGDTDIAYAMVNHKEFFAEMSVTFLAGEYRDLDGASPKSIEACSPPLMSPVAIDRVKKMHALTEEHHDDDEDDDINAKQQSSSLRSTAMTASISEHSFCSSCDGRSSRDRLIARVVGAERRRGLNNIFSRLRLPPLFGRGRHVPHCNKFFPFTRRQLIRHDPETAEGMSALWHAIACWDEDDEDGIGGDGEGGLFACWGWTG